MRGVRLRRRSSVSAGATGAGRDRSGSLVGRLCGCGGLWLLFRVPTTPHLLLLERSSVSSSVAHSPARKCGPAGAGGDGAGEAPSAQHGNGA